MSLYKRNIYGLIRLAERIRLRNEFLIRKSRDDLIHYLLGMLCTCFNLRGSLPPYRHRIKNLDACLIKTDIFLNERSVLQTRVNFDSLCVSPVYKIAGPLCALPQNAADILHRDLYKRNIDQIRRQKPLFGAEPELPLLKPARRVAQRLLAFENRQNRLFIHALGNQRLSSADGNTFCGLLPRIIGHSRDFILLCRSLRGLCRLPLRR